MENQVNREKPVFQSWGKDLWFCWNTEDAEGISAGHRAEDWRRKPFSDFLEQQL